MAHGRILIHYNCYAYAIRRASAGDIEPGDYSSEPASNTILSYAYAVKDGLTNLGYSATMTTVKPTSLSNTRVCFHSMKGWIL